MANQLAKNRSRAGLWLPVAFGAGIFGYFELRFEPPFWGGPVMCGLLILLLLFTRRSLMCVFCLIPVLMASAGFSAAQFRTLQVSAPVLKREIAASLTGIVEEVRVTSRGERAVVRVEQLGRLAPEDRPDRVRLLVLKRDRMPSAGSRITVFGRFRPPPPPVAPYAYDFQRALFFNGIGAVGFALGSVTVTERRELRLSGSLSTLRNALSERIRSRLPGDTGALAAALLVGDRDWISEHAAEIMRDAGIAHLLAISGLHMGLIAGCVFFSVRLLLSLHPITALRWPTRTVAAISAILFATIYLLLSGASVPSQRAYIMTTVVLIGVLIGRRAISMRLIASAAFVIMAVRPEYILGASFQLSFAAVTCLVAVYESGGWSRYSVRDRRFGRLLQNTGLLALSSLVASCATLPFTLYHFQKAALYGVATNMLAVPAASLWIMPFGAATLFLLPFGLEELALQPMGLGIDAVLWLAGFVQNWPYATHRVAAAPGWIIGLVALSGLWLCLLRGRVRLGSIPLLGVCIGALIVSPWVPPTLIVSDRAKTIGVFSEKRMISTSRQSTFAVDIWRRRAGEPEENGHDQATSPKFHCDSLGCVMDATRIGTVALSNNAQSLAEDCHRADILVSRVRIPDDCSMPGLILGPKHIRAGGSIAIWLDGPAPEVVYSRKIQGNRPWSGAVTHHRN